MMGDEVRFMPSPSSWMTEEGRICMLTPHAVLVY